MYDSSKDPIKAAMYITQDCNIDIYIDYIFNFCLFRIIKKHKIKLLHSEDILKDLTTIFLV